MKGIRFLLMLVIGLTLFVTPAQAKGIDRVGFIVLVKQANSAMPLAMQAQKAFQHIQRQLQALQKNGTIIEFEADLSAGIVKIRYNATSAMSEIASMKVISNIHTAFAQVPHQAKSVAHTEAFNPLFYPLLWSSCFDAYNLGTSSYVIASLLDKTSVVVGNYAGYADSSGHLNDCFNWNSNYSDIIPGYKVVYKLYTTRGGTLLGTFTGAIPTLTINNIDNVNSIVGGVGPAGKSFWVDWYHPNLNAANTNYVGTQTGTIPSNGNWSVDFGTTRLRGNDYLDYFVTLSSRFIFEYSTYVPYAYCEIGSNYCGLEGLPRQSASMTITHALTPYTFSGKFSNWSWFPVYLEDSSGQPIYIASGDQVGGTGITNYTLPTLTATVNFTTNVISGKAPANKYFYVYVYDVYYDYWYSIWTQANASGFYSANFTSQFDLKASDALTFEVYYTDPTSGFKVDKYIPYVP